MEVVEHLLRFMLQSEDILVLEVRVVVGQGKKRNLMKCPHVQILGIHVLLFLSLLLMYILVSQYLIKNPVEYVEEEKSQREAGSRHSVDLFGSVDK